MTQVLLGKSSCQSHVRPLSLYCLIRTPWSMWPTFFVVMLTFTVPVSSGVPELAFLLRVWTFGVCSVMGLAGRQTVPTGFFVWRSWRWEDFRLSRVRMRRGFCFWLGSFEWKEFFYDGLIWRITRSRSPCCWVWIWGWTREPGSVDCNRREFCGWRIRWSFVVVRELCHRFGCWTGNVSWIYGDGLW